MSRLHRAACLALAVLLLPGAALAAGPAPVRVAYTTGPVVPEPVTQVAGLRGICDPAHAAAKDERRVRTPYPGRLTVQLDRFAGDWALGVFDPAGRAYAVSDQFVDEDQLERPERVRLLLRRPGTVVVLRACNLAGGTTARVRYRFDPL